jgi:hypothetical protein
MIKHQRLLAFILVFIFCMGLVGLHQIQAGANGPYLTYPETSTMQQVELPGQ